MPWIKHKIKSWWPSKNLKLRMSSVKFSDYSTKKSTKSEAKEILSNSWLKLNKRSMHRVWPIYKKTSRSWGKKSYVWRKRKSVWCKSWKMSQRRGSILSDKIWSCFKSKRYRQYHLLKISIFSMGQFKTQLTYHNSIKTVVVFLIVKLNICLRSHNTPLLIPTIIWMLTNQINRRLRFIQIRLKIRKNQDKDSQRSKRNNSSVFWKSTIYSHLSCKTSFKSTRENFHQIIKWNCKLYQMKEALLLTKSLKVKSSTKKLKKKSINSWTPKTDTLSSFPFFSSISLNLRVFTYFYYLFFSNEIV